jgi:hypothetical protein
MIKTLYSLFVIKMLRAYYYRNLIKTSGQISHYDMMVDVFASFVLFYSVNMLIEKDIEKEALIYFAFDTISSVVFLWSYVYYINKENSKSYLEAFEEDKQARDELANMEIEGKLKDMNVRFKPSSSEIKFMDINVVQLLCVVPYFLVIYE